jgi:uncharacterized protein (DUF433 family)
MRVDGWKDEVHNMGERIEISPRVCGGKPVIAGTRIPVTVILEQLEEGGTWESILEGYPELSRDDIRAAIQYAKAAIDHTEIVALTTH